MSTPTVTQVADGVHVAQGTSVSWILLTEGDAFTLVDAGYPGDRDAVLSSIEQIGYSLDQLEAVLVTHAHVDHIGSLPRLLEGRDVPVLTSEVEAHHARREFLEQATPLQVAAASWRPRVLAWSLHVVAAGGTTKAGVPQAQGFAEGALDLPGLPVPIVTPGHTSGHTCYHLPHTGVLVTGDALVTGHPTVRRTGPQLLPRMFHHDVAANRRSLDQLRRLSGDVLLPGHGVPWRGSYADAVDQALNARR
ncbi:MBL fold metallo-hydrolase [Aeromicrobium sp. NPDC092404]|uniref:MBL fold metallo-hydrolase n=1 Tax=Aeromicrobium sp. NPDC092404 TaxID=3154976 RepID=UPI00344AD44E